MATSRTQLIADLLSNQQQRRQKRPIFSVGQGVAGLGSDLITTLAQRKVTDEQGEQETAANQARSDALAKILGAPQGGRQSAIADVLGGGQLNNVPGLRNILTEQALAPQQQQETFEPTFGPQGGITGQRSSTTGRVVPDPRTKQKQEQFEPVFNQSGAIVGQRNLSTGQVVSDPRATEQQDQFEPVVDEQGNVIGQRNVKTGQETASPSGQEVRRIAEREEKSAIKESEQTNAQDAAVAGINDTISVIDRLLDNEDLGAGFGKSGLIAIPGSTVADIQAQVNTLKARLGFDQLQKMRDASPTGGALGQVSERELSFLQATVQSLDFNQSDEQAIENMGLIRDSMKRWRSTIKPVPDGLIDNGDGTFTMSDGTIVERE